MSFRGSPGFYVSWTRSIQGGDRGIPGAISVESQRGATSRLSQTKNGRREGKAPVHADPVLVRRACLLDGAFELVERHRLEDEGVGALGQCFVDLDVRRFR